MTQDTDRSRNSSEPVSRDPLLTARETAGYFNMSLPSLWRRVADGTIPKPLKIGHLSRWPRSEILAAIQAAKASRDST